MHFPAKFGLKTHFLANLGSKYVFLNLFEYADFFQGGTCALPKFIISFNLILCIIVSIISILPRIQENMPSSGLLQSAFISLYVMYLTWSALMNNPDKACNPSLISIVTHNSTSQHGKEVEYGTPLPAESIVALVIWFLCLLYASIRSSSNTSLGKITGGSGQADDDIPLSEWGRGLGMWLTPLI